MGGKYREVFSIWPSAFLSRVFFMRDIWPCVARAGVAGVAEQLGDSVKLGHSVKRVSSAFERTPNPSSFFLSCY